MKEFLTKYFTPIITIASFISGAVFWFFTMNGIPPRVTKLEQNYAEIRTQVIKNDTKIDVILEDTKFMKQLMTQRYVTHP